MSIPARQSTALELSVGPVLDADGVAVTDCVVGDFKLKKTTGNYAALNGSATLTHVSAGTYDLVLTTSDTDTVGLSTVSIDDTTNTCAPVRMQVIEEAVYDRDYAASAVGYVANAPVSVAQWNGTNVATPDTAGYPKVTYKQGTGAGELYTPIGSGIITVNTGLLSGDAGSVGYLASYWGRQTGAHTGAGVLDQGNASAVSSTTLTLRAGGINFGANQLRGATLAVYDNGNSRPHFKTIRSNTSGTTSVLTIDGWDVATPSGTIYYQIHQSLADVETLATSRLTSARATALDNLDATVSSRSSAADMTTLLGRLTSARAGYLDNLNVGGAVASQADINALNQSASRRVILTTVQQYERPESGATVYTIEARTYSDDGVPMASTGDPTLTATGQTTGSLAANLGAVSSPATGVYRWAYSVEDDATLEPVRFDFSAVVDGDTIPMSVYTQVCDFVAATFTTADRALLEAIPTNAEFEARTLPSADYFDPATDVVANVTLVGTVTAVTGLTASNLDATVSSRATPAQVNSALSDIGLTLARVKRLVSMASGKIVENPSESGVFEFYDEDGTTLLYTLTAAGDERTPDLSP